MSEDKRSRRRFLADMLFLGGAAGAAAFIAKSKFGGKEPAGGGCEIPKPQDPLPTKVEPVPAGSAPLPQPPEQPLHSLGEASLPEPQAKGDMVIPQQEPQKDGMMALPKAPPAPVQRPNVRGRMKISRPINPKPGEQL